MEIENLLDILRYRARTTPATVALRSKDGVVSYEDLDRASNQMARAIAAQRAKPGARLAILAKNTAAQMDIWWGALKSRTTLVPVNYRLVARELAFILNDSGAEILFVGRDFYAVAQAMLPDLRSVRKVVAIDGGHAEWGALRDWKDRHDADAVEALVGISDVALQIYTSGTTGRPKGVQITHANLIADQLRSEGTGLWSDKDVALLCMPLCHLGGCGVSLRSVYFGMEIVLMNGFEAVEVMHQIAKYRVTKAFFVPSMLHIMLNTPGCREADFSSLDLVFYGAGAMPFELLTEAMKVFPCRFATGYGMTETSGAVTYLAPEDHLGVHARERMKSCGRPNGARIRILGKKGDEVATGEVGEIVCSSPQVMIGYFGQPQETAEAIRDGWLHTGDAGFFDADGYLHISDRIKDMIVSGGLNIYPREIEEVLMEHPAIAEVAVIGVPDDRWREAVKAIVVTKAGNQISVDELIAFARERMAKYKVPQSVDFSEALPRNTSGKVLKRELRLPFWTGRERLV